MDGIVPFNRNSSDPSLSSNESIEIRGAQKAVTRNEPGPCRQRKASPSYAVHVQKCRQRGALLHSAVVSGHVSEETLEEFDEPRSSMSLHQDHARLSPDIGSGASLELAFSNIRISATDCSAATTSSSPRQRTLSASSRTSVDSLRSQNGNIIDPDSVRGNTATSALPLSTFEVYELSRYMDVSETSATTTVKNPNKILLTIDLSSSTIIAANSTATNVFGYEQHEFKGMLFSELLVSNNYLEELTLNEEHCGLDGHNLSISEKLLIAVDRTGEQFPVSIWMKYLPSNHSRHCLAIMEPVERTTGILTTDMDGRIVDADPQLAPVFGFHSNPGDLLDSSIHRLIPKLSLPPHRTPELPKELRHQHVIGHVTDGTKLPLTVLMRFSNETDPVPFAGAQFPSAHNALEFDSDLQYTIMLYHNVTGLLTLGTDGQVSACDSHFCTLLFGYSPQELEKMDIEELIPGLLEEITSLGVKLRTLSTVPYHMNSNNESRCTSCGTGFSSGTSAAITPADAGKVCSSAELDVILEQETSGCPTLDWDSDEQRTDLLLSQLNSQDISDSVTSLRSPTPEPTIKPPKASSKNSRHVRSAASSASKQTIHSGDILSDRNSEDDNPLDLPLMDSPDDDGLLLMLSINTNAIHKNDFEISVNVKIKYILFSDEVPRLCLWVKRTDIDDRPGSDMSNTLLNLEDEEEMEQRSEADMEKANLAAEAFKGPYEDTYMTLKTVGQGAFGDVKLAAHKTTYDQVIVKCIGKKEVLTCSWTPLSETEMEKLDITRDPHCTRRKGAVPTELYLLRTLSHPNIVSLVAVFETDHFYQLVMPKHGKGMDLFTFIDLEPSVDEPLACFIFSQVVDAVEYLHEHNVIHRDIKDENIIIDQNFQVKLIDFGSATFFKKDELFDTFCGTIEYCAPEVLLGNKYEGPELEMWTLGVTLYTLVFFENPFRDADEVITGHLDPPFCVSAGLTQVLLWLLHPDPLSRCTIVKLRDCTWMKQQVDGTKYDFGRVITGVAPVNPNNLKTRMDSAKQKKNRRPSHDVLRVSCKSH